MSFLHKVTLPKQQLVPLFVSSIQDDLSLLVDLAKEGKLETHIDTKHPIEKAEDAWTKMFGLVSVIPTTDNVLCK